MVGAAMTLEPIQHELRLRCSAGRAFSAYVDRIDEWWPPWNTRSAATLRAVALEPRAGGRLYASHRDGDDEWGRVTACDPPRRIEHTFTLAQDPATPSEIAVSFTPDGDGCLLRFEHRGWTPANAALRDKFRDWPMMLARLAALAEAELTVRPAREGDRDAAQHLLIAQLLEHRLPAEAERVARGLAAAFAPGSPAWLWMAERRDRTVGVLLANELASVEHGGLSLWIEELYVPPEARRTGVARALLARVFERARERGLRAVDLEVVPSQAAALALYRALGFEAVHRSRWSRPL
jgi:ribosomal protein S18 acetylase RimI-like enzyme